MNRRFVAALGALVVSGVAVIGVSGTASAAALSPSASQTDCNSAAAATAAAQVNFTNALNVAVARAKELGFTADQIAQAQSLITQASSVSAVQSQLMMIYVEHPTSFNLATDGPKVAALANAKLALGAAQAAQTIACTGFTPMVTMPAPMTTTPAPVATPAMPAPMLMPMGAPATGDGSSLNY